MADAPVALVTAASKGIGAACARELAARGWRVALLARSEGVDTLAGELGGRATRGDIAAAADLDRFVDETLDAYGRIDGAVLSTGHPPKGSLLDLTDADWHAGLDLVLLPVIRIARRITPQLRERRGAIVNISSFAAFEPDARFPVSSALRAALGAVCKLYADAEAKHGVRMNNLLPGFIDTLPVKPEIVPTIPMQRYGRGEEIAKTAAFLLSADAGYITGQNLRADGGLTRSV
ncbi:MAG TPA: SDR family oxidoreductase [Casimicrobiaceae bacterium]|nr:SDR family oxidoreductase [Casimicrobiaceae bacterium]